MMRFIDDYEIEMRSRVKIKQSILPASAMLFALIHATVQYRIRNDCFVVPDWPFFIPMGIGNGLPQDSTVQRNEVFIKPPHLQFPLALRNQRFRANDQNVVQFVSGFQFLDDQACLNRFTDTDAVRD